MSRIADVLRKIHESNGGQASDLPGGTDPLALKRPQDIAVPWRLPADADEPRGTVPSAPDAPFSPHAALPAVYEPLPTRQPAPPFQTPPQAATVGVDREIAALVETLFGNGSAVAAQSAPRRIVFAYLPGAPVPASFAVQVASRLATVRSNRSVGLLDLDCSGQDALSAELRVHAGPGFADIALDQADVEAVAHPISGARNLRFIGPGSHARERKTQLLASKQSQSGHRAVNAFDYVVAVAAAADLRYAAPLLASFDGLALVVDPRLTTAEGVKTAAAQLTRAGIRLLGAVLDTRGASRTSQIDADRPPGTTLKYVPAPFR